jgi:ketosteroid isomerase-like protein
VRLRRLLVVIFLFPVCAYSQNSPAPVIAATAEKQPSPQSSTLPPAPPAADAAQLTKLLKDFLAGASRNDLTMHDRFWADDLIYTGSSGRRLGKADIMREVRAEAAAKSGQEPTTYTAEDIRIQQYGSIAIAAFRLIGTSTNGNKTELANYLNSGTFLKRNGKWQVVNWQATKIPSENEPRK